MIIIAELPITTGQADPSPLTARPSPNLNVSRAVLQGRIPTKLRVGLLEAAATATVELWALVERDANPRLTELGAGAEPTPSERRYIQVSASLGLTAGAGMTDLEGDIVPGAFFLRVTAANQNATLFVAAV